MNPFLNVTAAEYGSWLVKTIQHSTDQEQISELRAHYEDLVADLSYLERCYSLDPYEPTRSV